MDLPARTAKNSDIRTLFDNAITEIEVEKTSLKGVLPKDYARSDVDAQHIGELIDLIGTIGLSSLQCEPPGTGFPHLHAQQTFQLVRRWLKRDPCGQADQSIVRMRGEITA